MHMNTNIIDILKNNHKKIETNVDVILANMDTDTKLYEHIAQYRELLQKINYRIYLMDYEKDADRNKQNLRTVNIMLMQLNMSIVDAVRNYNPLKDEFFDLMYPTDEMVN